MIVRDPTDWRLSSFLGFRTSRLRQFLQLYVADVVNQNRAEQSGGDNVEATHARGLPSSVFSRGESSYTHTTHSNLRNTMLC